ncbi:outer membrane beta-barrel protein [Zooshikella harenae]|uniref:Outer membrane beta-barrel protein n=1 Tax=Zooshikella harenae TaxID=2827238 RepID=A0ABS5ZAB0_9GAMM|nr:outer membrane beta-barrel protein [Zooshikella harenae]MBU2710991.1 outer membrane beta-barrel protein [Zooshikella harenae]
MKKQILVLCITTLMSGVTLAQGNGFYLGGNVGQTDFDECADGFSCDEKDTGWKLYGGYQLNQNIGIEAGYYNFGETTGKNRFGKYSVEAEGLGVALTGTLPLNNQFSLTSKIGAMRWEADGHYRGRFTYANDDETGTDLFYGVGAKFALAPNLDIVAEWERIDDVSDVDHVDFVSAGVQLKF